VTFVFKISLTTLAALDLIPFTEKESRTR
jgi:hypothetical protein